MDRFVVEGLIRLRNGPEFEALRKWLAERMEKRRTDCTLFSGDTLFRTQGRAQELQELMKLIEDAPKLFEQLRSK